MVRDPVGGMEVAPAAPFAVRQHKGQTFYFCSDKCVKSFDEDPGRYAGPVSATTGVPETATGTVRLDLPVRGLSRSGGPALAQALRGGGGGGNATPNTRAGPGPRPDSAPTGSRCG